tara:strand:- start:452 stop:637 length:186 start_codon:yes stop_codon:yes gene_type:complete
MLKTPVYQRKAYKAYLERNKDNEEFIQKRRDKQKEYYERNKARIAERKKHARQLKNMTINQ